METSWKKVLHDEFKKDYFINLNQVISRAYVEKTVFPSKENVFHAFALCPFNDVKVVILGQDPYHGEGQAQGLAFSVPDKVKIPPSLKNIYKELINDLGTEVSESCNLEHWAKQGLLLLNSTLTVESGHPGSHQGLGWETFTDVVIKQISDNKEHVVFLLWGNFARSKTSLIDETKHLILQAPHPSPFSAHKGFFGCKHFSQTNKYLREKNLREIDW